MADTDLLPPDARLRNTDHTFQIRSRRRRTFLNGKLAYGDGIFAPDGAFTLDCSIRDLSEGGARIVLAKRQPIPVSLYLIVVKFAVAYHASVVWLNLSPFHLVRGSE